MIRRRHNWQRARARSRTIKTTKNVAASSSAERRRVLVIHESYINFLNIISVHRREHLMKATTCAYSASGDEYGHSSCATNNCTNQHVVSVSLRIDVRLVCAHSAHKVRTTHVQKP